MSAANEMVTLTAESKLYVTRSVQVPMDAIFGWGVGGTEVVECGYCYALVAEARVTAHDMWHREQDGLAGQ